MPFPTDIPTETESEIPIRKPRRKRRRRRKRPRTSTHTYDKDIDHQPAAQYQEPQELQEPDYAEVYVRRRPIKRRRRPIQRKPVMEGADEENVLPRRKLIRRPVGFGNKTRNEDVKQWNPITSTEETRWKPVRTTTETTITISTTSAKSTIIASTTTAAPKMTTIAVTFSTQKFTEDNNKINNHVESSKISNSSHADVVVLHKRPINSKLPPTSAVIRRRLKPQNTTSEETTTIKPKMIVIKEELPMSLLPPDFKIAQTTNTHESINNSNDYQFNDEALTKMMKEQTNNKNNEFKFKSDSIPKVKDEILSLLKTKTGSLLLLNVLNLRNMSLEELLQHRERGSSQRHQELIDTKDEQIYISSDEPMVTDNTKNFTNYLIETKRLAQNNKDTVNTEPLNSLKLFSDINSEDSKRQSSIQSTNTHEQKQNEHNTKISKVTEEINIDNIKLKIPIQVLKKQNLDDEVNILQAQKQNDHLSNTNVEKDKQREETDKIKSDIIFKEKKGFSFPTTTTYTTTNVKNQENEETSFITKSPKTRIVLENSEREPRLFDSMPDFTIKTTPRPFVTPTIPSQVLFIQDTNHLDEYQSYEEKNKDIDEDNNLVYRRFEMRKLPVAVKSAIIASAAILAIAVLGFFVLLISCRMRQKKRVLRKKSVFCQHNIHHEPDLRSSARSTSPVMDNCQDQYYDGYGGRIDAHTEANRQYYLWRTLRKTFRYD